MLSIQNLNLTPAETQITEQCKKELIEERKETGRLRVMLYQQ
jgi:hypothetical protein